MSREPDESITRSEFLEAVRRLDAADAELRSGAKELERVLRTEFEDKIAAAVEGVKDTVQATHGNLKEDVNDIKEHLTWQDRLMYGTLATILATIVAFGVLHYAFHVG